MNIHDLDGWAEKLAGPIEKCYLCPEYMLRGERYYYVTSLERDANGHERPVCYRHVKGGRP